MPANAGPRAGAGNSSPVFQKLWDCMCGMDRSETGEQLPVEGGPPMAGPSVQGCSGEPPATP